RVEHVEADAVVAGGDDALLALVVRLGGRRDGDSGEDEERDGGDAQDGHARTLCAPPARDKADPGVKRVRTAGYMRVALFRRRAMRSGSGGWVLNSRDRKPGRFGSEIHRCDIEVLVRC